MTRRAFAVLATLVLVASLALPARGSADEPGWSRPANLSQSSAATSPEIVLGSAGEAYTFWWDQYDGLTVAVQEGEAWSDPLAVPFQDYLFDADNDVKTNTRTGASLRSTITKNGTVVGDGAGGVVALFQAVTEASGAPALRLVRAGLGDWAWTDAETVVSSVSAWHAVAGAPDELHLVVFYAGRTGDMEPGIYYLRSDDGGASWGEMVPIAESLYVRRAKPDSSHIRLAVSPSGSLYVAWNEPGTGRALWSWSPDGGASWMRPSLVSPSDRAATNAHVAITGERGVVMLWQGTGTGTTPALYTSASTDGGYNWSAAEVVLPGLTGTDMSVTLVGRSDGPALAVAGGQSGGPLLAAFGSTDGSLGPQWSDPVSLRYPTASTATLAVAGIKRWTASWQPGRLVLAGEDDASDVWALAADVSTVAWNYSGAAQWVDEPADTAGGARVLASAGAVQPPRVIAGAGMARQAYWWDVLEGLTSAYSTGGRWYEPQPALAYAGRTGSQVIPPFGAILVGDGEALVRAFWIDRAEGEIVGPLLTSLQTLGQHTWSEPTAVTEVATALQVYAGADRTWHLLYARGGAGEGAPGGIYYATLAPGTEEWSTPALVAEIAPEVASAWQEGDLGLAVRDVTVHALWRDPLASALYYARSADGGQSWMAPVDLAAGLPDPARPHLATVEGGAIALFQASGEAGLSLFQSRMDDQGIVSAPAIALRSLEGTFGLPASWVLTGDPGSEPLLAVTESAGELSVSAWTGASDQSGWGTAERISLMAGSAVTAAFEPTAIDVIYTQGRLAISTLGLEGEAAILDVTRTENGWSASSEEAWSWPKRISALEADAGKPVAGIDAAGRLHVMWHAGEASAPALWYTRLADGSWAQAAPVIQPQEGIALDPSLAAADERLYVSYAGGENGRVDFASAFGTDAHAAASWSAPEPLPGPVSPRYALGAHPSLVVDLGGTLHATYAVPINQYRGIYYTRSTDGGVTWSPASLVFDASAAGWPMVDSPTVAIDHDGTLYVAWLRLDLAGAPSVQALYLARSWDGGETWTEARLVAEGAFADPVLVIGAAGQPHLLWQDADQGHAVWHSWSADGGEAWSLPMRVRGLADLSGGAGVASNEAGTVYLAALQDTEAGPALQTAVWEGDAEQWTLDAPWRLPAAVMDASDVTLALAPDEGYLAALIVSDLRTAEGTEHALLYSARSVPARPSQPVWSGEAQAGQSALPEATPVPTATPRPVVDVSAPPTEEGALRVGPMTVPVLTIGGLVLVALIVAGVMVARGRARR